MTKAMYIGIPNNPTVTLPSGYTQLEYIESSGTQYIDTGFKPNYNSRVVVDVSNVKNNTASIGFLFGTRNSSSSGKFAIYINTDTNVRSDYMSNQANLTVSDTSVRTTIDKNKNVVTMYGSTLTNSSASSGSCNYNLFLFALNDGGTCNLNSSMRLYSCQIYDNGTLVRNFVPVKKSDGTIGLYDTVNSKFYQNSGNGTFVAGTAFDGKSVARKVNKMYVGVDNKARKVKKAYIGVNGIARKFFGGELKYKGATALSANSGSLASANVGNYAIFAGGRNSSGYVSRAQACDDNLTVTLTGTTAALRINLAGVSLHDYALFAGGKNGNTYSKVVEAYNSALTKSTLTTLSVARSDLGGASVGDYAIFAGGKNSSNSYLAGMEIYNSGLTKINSNLYSLGENKSNMASVSLGNYAIFAGGICKYDYDPIYYTTAVDYLDNNLTQKGYYDFLSVARSHLTATTVGNYAIFAGGRNGDGEVNTVDVCDKSLTKIGVNIVLSSVKDQLTATTLGDYAIFAGGYSMMSSAGKKIYATVDVFDSSLTKTTVTNLSTARYNLASATIGNYALFAGGTNGSNYYNTVDVYEVA